MTTTTVPAVAAFLATLDEPAGDCGGCMYQLCSKYGSVSVVYPTAHAAMLASGMKTTACPSDPHFDYYNFTTGGVNYGHVDWHVPSAGKHYANSSRCTAWLNPQHTVGTYATWGTRAGWSYTYGVNKGPVISTTLPTHRVAKVAANHRREPNTTSAIIESIKAGTDLALIGFIRGETYEGNYYWYVAGYGTPIVPGYFWSGNFTDLSMHDLKDMGTYTPPVVTPPVVTPPVVTPPVVTPPVVDPPVVTPPVVTPPVVTPPVVDPPVVTPPPVDPPVVDPPVVDPPVVDPPGVGQWAWVGTLIAAIGRFIAGIFAKK